MQWCFIHGELHARCRVCMDFFAVDSGMEDAGYGVREGREAVMPDGRPCRSIEEVVKDAVFDADCEV